MSEKFSLKDELSKSDEEFAKDIDNEINGKGTAQENFNHAFKRLGLFFISRTKQQSHLNLIMLILTIVITGFTIWMAILTSRISNFALKQDSQLSYARLLEFRKEIQLDRDIMSTSLNEDKKYLLSGKKYFVSYFSVSAYSNGPLPYCLTKEDCLTKLTYFYKKLELDNSRIKILIDKKTSINLTADQKLSLSLVKDDNSKLLKDFEIEWPIANQLLEVIDDEILKIQKNLAN